MKRLFAGALLLLLPACGYRVVRGDAPFGVHELAVIPFAEDEPVGLSPELTTALIRRLASGGVRISNEPASAGGVLTGRILSAGTIRSPVAGVGSPIPAYRIRTQIEVTLVHPDGTSLWKTQLNLTEDFLAAPAGASTTALETEANRRRGLHRLAETAAREIHQRLILASAAAPEGES